MRRRGREGWPGKARQSGKCLAANGTEQRVRLSFFCSHFLLRATRGAPTACVLPPGATLRRPTPNATIHESPALSPVLTLALLGGGAATLGATAANSADVSWTDLTDYNENGIHVLLLFEPAEEHVEVLRLGGAAPQAVTWGRLVFGDSFPSTSLLPWKGTHRVLRMWAGVG